MAKQFNLVDCSRGAPMGRSNYGQPQRKGGVSLFKVRLDKGGYDDGGAYWGFPCDIYCAVEDDTYRAFVRAKTRREAAEKLGVTYFLRRK